MKGEKLIQYIILGTMSRSEAKRRENNLVNISGGHTSANLLIVELIFHLANLETA